MPTVVSSPSNTYNNFFFIDAATTEIYTLSLHDALPICCRAIFRGFEDINRSAINNPSWRAAVWTESRIVLTGRSEEHTSELQSLRHLVCRLLLEKKRSIGITRLRRHNGFHVSVRKIRY